MNTYFSFNYIKAVGYLILHRGIETLLVFALHRPSLDTITTMQQGDIDRKHKEGSKHYQDVMEVKISLTTTTTTIKLSDCQTNLIVHVKYTILDLLVNLLCRVDKCLNTNIKEMIQ